MAKDDLKRKIWGIKTPIEHALVELYEELEIQIQDVLREHPDSKQKIEGIKRLTKAYEELVAINKKLRKRDFPYPPPDLEDFIENEDLEELEDDNEE